MESGGKKQLILFPEASYDEKLKKGIKLPTSDLLKTSTVLFFK